MKKAKRMSTKSKKLDRTDEHVFVDEEIDEDTAFVKEDYLKYGDVGNEKNQRKSEQSEESEEEDGDDESVYRNLSDLVEENDPTNTFEFWRHQGLLRKVSSVMEPQKKKAKVEIKESKPESQFNVEAQEKVTLNDLMKGISDQDQYQSLKEKIQKIEKTSDDSIVKLPTPNVVKDKELRQAQFEDTSKELSQWVPTVYQMKNAPTLSFPLEKPEEPVISTNLLAENFVPETPLEKQIHEVIESKKQSTEKVLQDAQSTFTHKGQMSKDAQIAKLRSMLLYQEKKFKWQKKIKSRSYRRILRKQKEKQKLTIEELRELDPKTANDEAEKQEKTRALERVTLRHKTVGKWARGASKSKNPLLKQQLLETHQLGQDLRKKIDRIKSESSEEEGEEPSSSSEEPEIPHKGLFAMKFMQRAQEKKKIEYKNFRQDIQKEEEERNLKLEIAAKKLRGEDVTQELKKLKGEEPEEETKGRKNYSGQKRSTKTENRKNVPGGNKNKIAFTGNYQTEEVALGTGFTSKVSNPITINKAKNPSEKPENSEKSEKQENSEKLEKPENSEKPEKSEKSEKLEKSEKSEKLPTKENPKLFEVPDFPEVQIEETEEKDLYDVNKLSTVVGENIPKKKNSNGISQKRKFNSEETQKRKPSESISKKRKTKNSNGSTVTSEDTSEPVLLKPVVTTRNIKNSNFPAEDKLPQKEIFATTPRPLAENPWMKIDSEKPTPELDSKKTQKSEKINRKTPNNSENSRNSQNSENSENHQNRNNSQKIRKNSENHKKVNLDLDQMEERATQAVIAKSKPIFNLIASTSKTQKELIQRAFAHDDVEAEFEAEKMRKVEMQLPNEDLDLQLPGWGDWAGAGLVYKPKPKDLQKIENQKKKREEIRKKRRDAKLAKVIINEQKNPIISKYQVPSVPKGFPNAEAYERNHRNPLGKEWNSYKVHDVVVKPKVIVEVGNVIDPVQHKVDSEE